MTAKALRKALLVYVLLLIPVAWIATRYQPYLLDGDGVAYMDIADLLHAHQWAGAVNGYWHPLYPAMLTLGQIVAHPSRWIELPVYRTVNVFIFFLAAAAMLVFTAALADLRDRWASPVIAENNSTQPLLSKDALQIIGLGLLVIASQRELAIAGIKPDTLLQAFMMLAFAMLLRCLASGSIGAAASMGVFFGLAYLTKSFAFLVGLLSIGVLFVFLWRTQAQKLTRALTAAVVSLLCFAIVAGPYVAALSKQKHRFDFGDSGALNYAWYAAGTRKFHVEPWMTSEFGTSTVHLVHPERQLLNNPGIYSYRAVPYGTFPEWFDPTYFHERTVPHLNPPVLLRRDLRNVELVFRYLLNHPEGLILLALLLAAGARLYVADWLRRPFWAPIVLLSLAMWGLYLIVNVEERYVTLAYLVLLLPLLAALRAPAESTADTRDAHTRWLRPAASGMVALLAFVALGESLRTAAEERRSSGMQPTWYAPEIYGAARGLQAMGIRPGEEIACMGTMACVNDIYWMRLAGVRTLTEVFNPDAAHLVEEWNGLPNREQVIDTLRAQGAKVLVARFGTAALNTADPALANWVRLGDTEFYALPLTMEPTLPPHATSTAPQPDGLPWPINMKVEP